jgi:hypothetical protein
MPMGRVLSPCVRYLALCPATVYNVARTLCTVDLIAESWVLVNTTAKDMSSMVCTCFQMACCNSWRSHQYLGFKALVTGRSNHWTSDYKLFLIHPLLHITICSNIWVFFYEIETGWQCNKSQSLQSAGLIQGEILLKLKFGGRFCFFGYASIYCPKIKKIVNYLNFSDVPSFTIHWVI